MKRVELARAKTIEEARVKADNFGQAHSRVQVRRMANGFKIVNREFDDVHEAKEALEKGRFKSKKKRLAIQAISEEAENAAN